MPVSVRAAEIREFTARHLGDDPHDRKVLSAYAAAAARWEGARSDELAAPSGPNVVTSERLAAAVRQLAVRLGITIGDFTTATAVSRFAVEGVTDASGHLYGDPARLLSPSDRMEQS